MSFDAGIGTAVGLGTAAGLGTGAVLTVGLFFAKDNTPAGPEGFEGPAAGGRPLQLFLPGTTAATVKALALENMYAGISSSDCCLKYAAKRGKRLSMRKTHVRCDAF